MADESVVIVPAKPWHASKTVWVGIVGVLIEILGLILDASGLLKIPPQYGVYLGVAVSILTIVLRRLSVQPIGGGPVALTPKDPGSKTLTKVD